jgi:hypothetical protein
MQQALHRSSLVPRGFVVESAYYEGDRATDERGQEPTSLLRFVPRRRASAQG